MRRTLLVLSLTLAMVTMLANDVLAQRRGGGGGGGGGNYGGGRGYSGRGGYYSGGNYGRGYGNGYGYGYGLGYGVGAWPGSYNYNSGYGYGQPNYYYADPVVQVPAVDVRQSFYAAPANNQAVTVTVLVPTVDAQVWFNGSATTQQGMQRVFSSPPLDQGFAYTYTIKGRWMENGQNVDRERQVNVQSGQAITVDLRNNTGERIAAPGATTAP